LSSGVSSREGSLKKRGTAGLSANESSLKKGRPAKEEIKRRFGCSGQGSQAFPLTEELQRGQLWAKSSRGCQRDRRLDGKREG